MLGVVVAAACCSLFQMSARELLLLHSLILYSRRRLAALLIVLSIAVVPFGTLYAKGWLIKSKCKKLAAEGNMQVRI